MPSQDKTNIKALKKLKTSDTLAHMGRLVKSETVEENKKLSRLIRRLIRDVNVLVNIYISDQTAYSKGGFSNALVPIRKGKEIIH